MGLTDISDTQKLKIIRVAFRWLIVNKMDVELKTEIWRFDLALEVKMNLKRTNFKSTDGVTEA